jgi:hypothetical protein
MDPRLTFIGGEYRFPLSGGGHISHLDITVSCNCFRCYIGDNFLAYVHNLSTTCKELNIMLCTRLPTVSTEKKAFIYESLCLLWIYYVDKFCYTVIIQFRGKSSGWFEWQL